MERDPKLWKIAKKRAGFKQNLFSYLIVNLFLWGLWWLAAGQKGHNTKIPWPVWVMLAWGIGLVFNYLEAYTGGDKHSMAEDEYERLKRQQQKDNI
jgi:hypothetical protein